MSKKRSNVFSPEVEYIEQAASLLSSGSLVVFPTETVYGIAVNTEIADSVKRLYDLKQRDYNKPLSYHFGSLDHFYSFCGDGCSKNQKMYFEQWIPNPVTIIYYDSNKKKKIGVRIPDNETAQQILLKSNCHAFMTSANLSGEQSATKVSQLSVDFLNQIDYVIDGGETKFRLDSTVVDVSGEKPVIIRQGGFTI